MQTCLIRGSTAPFILNNPVRVEFWAKHARLVDLGLVSIPKIVGVRHLILVPLHQIKTLWRLFAPEA